VDPNQPSELEIQVELFNKKFYKTKRLVGYAFLALLGVFIVDLCFPDGGISFHFVVRALLWIIICLLTALLLYWRVYLSKVA